MSPPSRSMSRGEGTRVPMASQAMPTICSSAGAEPLRTTTKQ
nr:hypothetical protein [Frondihabitans australicus]